MCFQFMYFYSAESFVGEYLFYRITIRYHIVTLSALSISFNINFIEVGEGIYDYIINRNFYINFTYFI